MEIFLDFCVHSSLIENSSDKAKKENCFQQHYISEKFEN